MFTGQVTLTGGTIVTIIVGSVGGVMQFSDSNGGAATGGGVSDVIREGYVTS